MAYGLERKKENSEFIHRWHNHVCRKKEELILKATKANKWVPDFEVNAEKSVVFLYNFNEHLEIEIRK